MKERFLIVLSLLCLISCTSNGVEFTVTNDTKEKIDSVFITNYYDTIRINEINKSISKSGTMKFSDKVQKGDGNYFIKVYANDVIKDTVFGYISNGISSSSKYKIKYSEKYFDIEEIR